MFNKLFLRRLYISALCGIGFSLPLSVWMLSLFMIILGLVWIADRGPLRFSELIAGKFIILIFLSIYIVYLVWMINTLDINYGIGELRLKLPLLAFPLVIGLSDPLSKKELKYIITFFIVGVVISSLSGFLYYLYSKDSSTVSDPRNISVFISNVRLALMTDLAIAFSGWYFLADNAGKSKWLYLISAVWLILFLFLLLSVTGIVLFGLILFIVIIRYIIKSKNTIIRAGLSIIMVLLILLPSDYIINEVRHFYTKGNAYKFPLEERTINGNPYLHFPDRKDTENGNLVWIYLNSSELRKEWNLRSRIDFDGKDKKGQELRYTLIRYLASAGLKKDSAGLSSLGRKDIEFIENGVTNKMFTEASPVRIKLYEIIWQIDYYRNGGNPSGHSVTQRWEYFKIGWDLFTENPLFGTGTGDLREGMITQYAIDYSNIYKDYRFLPHNQYLTFLISFGLAGFIIICFSFTIPIIISRAYKSLMFNMFLVIILLSMIGEDTLDTHTGISFFAYFYALFVFGSERVNTKYNG